MNGGDAARAWALNDRGGGRVRLQEHAPGKVNLCLFLGPVRADGRHELVTVFESVSLEDELTIETLPEGPDLVLCPGVEGPNLVADALVRLRARGWDAPPVRIEIAKRIPVAAGMGGGSADAAAMLRASRRLGPVAEVDLAGLAAELGADVPGQLAPGFSLGTGAGDVVQLRSPLAPHALTVVPLPQQLATAAVYAEADRLGLPRSRAELEALQRELDRALEPGARPPASLLTNDLAPAACSLCPQIEGVLAAVLEAGADQALVCGSGPTVAGLHWGSGAADRAGEAAAALTSRFRAATAVVPVSSPTSGTI